MPIKMYLSRYIYIYIYMLTVSLIFALILWSQEWKNKPSFLYHRHSSEKICGMPFCLIGWYYWIYCNLYSTHVDFLFHIRSKFWLSCCYLSKKIKLLLCCGGGCFGSSTIIFHVYKLCRCLKCFTLRTLTNLLMAT